MEEHDKDSNNMKGGGMDKRGVTRPMAEMQMHQHHSEMQHGGQHQQEGHQHEKGEDHDMMMSDDMRKQMLHMHHMNTLWIYWALVVLGIWMVMSPLTFDYGRAVAEPSGGREVWLSLGQRISFMKWSDIISGGLLVFFGWRSLTPNRPQWWHPLRRVLLK